MTEIASVFGFIPHEWQQKVFEVVLAGEDVLLSAGTGSGKCILFQGLCLSYSMIVLVISPLIGLIDDQVIVRIDSS